MRNVLIVGAGKLGKGFLGEVFDAAKDWIRIRVLLKT